MAEIPKDERVWMYRKGGESKLFEKPADIPPGEGWVDSPPGEEDPKAPAPPADPKTQPKRS